MKYWWLEKYKNFKIVEINDLIKDVNYFLIMPKNYEKIYQEIRNEDISNLEEEELLILLKKITTTKNLKNNQLRLIIEKLLLIPDNSFPNSDYTLLEELTEIKNLKQNPPLKEKINSNNLAICYHCLNIFFVDKIKNVNKKNNCLCPYCLKQTLYFDNDYIPMNYTFIKLASFYYGVSSLGCSFKEIQKILKKHIVVVKKLENNFLDLENIIEDPKIKPIDEKIIARKLYLFLENQELNLEHSITLMIPDIIDYENLFLEIILVTIIEILTNTIYLSQINLFFKNKNLENMWKKKVKEVLSF